MLLVHVLSILIGLAFNTQAQGESTSVCADMMWMKAGERAQLSISKLLKALWEVGLRAIIYQLSSNLVVFIRVSYIRSLISLILGF